MSEIWFWQRIVSPHMAGLAVALAYAGNRVNFVAEEPMSADRVALGWQVPDLGGTRLIFAHKRNIALIVAEAGPSSVHICQGIRANGLVSMAQRLLVRRGLRQWVVMETVDDAGPAGRVKRLIYSLLFLRRYRWFEGVLATGYRTADWLVDRGVRANRVFPFAYFLPDVSAPVAPKDEPVGPFRFIYVGQLIRGKNVQLLLAALAQFETAVFELDVVGIGPLESELRELAERWLPGRVRWHGRLPSTEVQGVMNLADCLVLPSRHDGWGAVVSEAIMVGTPAICSDACGSAGVVLASGMGGVFPSGDMGALIDLLWNALSEGRIKPDRRERLASWGHCLGAKEGASYLAQIFASCEGKALTPRAPWLNDFADQEYRSRIPLQQAKS